MIGRVLDRRYRLVRLLGEGGMGSVWEAENLGTGRRLAIKMIKPEYASNTDMTKRFYREARAIGALKTPHVVEVYDCAQDAETGAPYLVMEMLSGEDVASFAKRCGFLAPDLALRIVAQALHGLAAAHAAGVAHRDIKPGNIFLARAGNGAVVVKLLDFGIAKQVEADNKATKLTQTGTPVGSPEYMSPEQIAGARVDHRTDIWSLGAVLYECLTERGPYEGYDSWLQLANAITESPPRAVQSYAPWVPRETAGIVYGAMAWVTERYQSADAMLEAVRRLLPLGYELHEQMLRPMPIELRRTKGELYAIRPFAKAATNAGVSTAARRQQGASGVAVMAGAIVIAAIVVSGVLLWQGRQRAQSAAASTQITASAEHPASILTTTTTSSAPAVTPVDASASAATSAEAPAASASDAGSSSASATPPAKATAPVRKPAVRTTPPATTPYRPPVADGMVKTF